MSVPGWLNALPTACVVSSAVLAAGGAARRWTAGMLALVALAAPYFLPEEWRMVRGVSAIVSFVGVIRCFDLVWHKEPTTPARRLAHVFSPADSFRLRRSAPSVPWAAVLRVICFLPLAIVALRFAPRGTSTGTWVAREACALLLVYSISEVAYASLNLVYRPLGLDPPVFHRDPALSRSLREFWGRRWNRIVGAWLDARLHRPFARRRMPLVGMSLAFVFSALVHVYVAHPALGTRTALVVGAFFLVQGAFALLEGPLRVALWPAVLGRAWTLTIMAGTAWMMCEPFLQLAQDP